MPSLREWVVIAGLIALVLIPICWYFWKKFDLPSLLARKEIARRKHERDVLEAFQKEEAKLLEIQRNEAQMELSRRKAIAPPPASLGELSTAFGNLSGESQATSPTQTASSATDSTGTEVLEGSSEVRRDEGVKTDISEVTELVNSLDDSDISVGGDLPSDSPVMMQLQGRPIDDDQKPAADSVDWSEPSDEPDDWKEVNW